MQDLAITDEMLVSDLQQINPVYYPWAYNLLRMKNLDALTKVEYFKVLPTLLYVLHNMPEDEVALRVRAKYDLRGIE